MKAPPRFFSRDIKISAVEQDAGSFLLTGTLADKRLLPYRHYLSGRMREPGVIHDMTVEMEISVPELKILSAKALLSSVPNEDCLAIAGCVEKIVGLSIKRGFTKSIRDLLGESRGCLHLTNLILTMGSAAAQALWAFYGSRKKAEKDRFSDLDEALLVNSCWLWRPDGPYASKLGHEKRQSALVIAIDGPAGSGKSTISRLLAGRLGLTYLDTGAIYRAVALLSAEQGIPAENGAALAELGKNISLEFRQGDDATRVIANGRDISEAIRTEKISMMASRISALPEVREALLPIQRGFAGKGGLVCEGRDMGTVVFPRADLKIYLDADPAERARRRHRELISRGIESEYESILREMRQRDSQDRGRETAPLKASEDAVTVDTTGMSISQVVDRIVELVCMLRV